MKSRNIFFYTVSIFLYLFSSYLFASEQSNNSLPPNAMLVAEVRSPEDILKAAIIAMQSGRPIIFVPAESNCIDPNTYNEETGMTVLQEECSKTNANFEKIKHMVEKHSADLNLLTKSPNEHPGLKAHELARDHDHHEIADYLENYEKNKNTTEQ